MGTPTYYYVDPAAGTDDTAGGRGDSAGDPWASIQFALNNITRDATNGDQINVKADQGPHVDDVLAAILDFSTYGTPAEATPCIIRGYASAANDGAFEAGTGIGGIDGNNGNFSISSTGFVYYVHMHLHNTGTAVIAVARFVQCELDTSTGGGVFGISNSVMGCHLHDISGASFLCKLFQGNFVDNTQAVKMSGNVCDTASTFARLDGNIFVVDSSFSAHVITVNDDNARAASNSIFATGAATGTGISLDANRQQFEVQNNLIEGFSGSGGKGIDGVSRSEGYIVFTNNGVRNCATPYANPADVVYESDNETLGATPFAKAGALTFANRFVYFAPVDTGNVQGGGFPVGSRIDKGAVQHADPAGGGGGGGCYILGG